MAALSPFISLLINNGCIEVVTFTKYVQDKHNTVYCKTQIDGLCIWEYVLVEHLLQNALPIPPPLEKMLKATLIKYKGKQ